MITTFVFSEGKPAGSDIDLDVLKLVRSDEGFYIWVDIENPTDEETKNVLEGLFAFHPVAIEDCITKSQLPKVEDYEEYLFLVMHAVDFNRRSKFMTSEINFFVSKNFLVTYHEAPLRMVRTIVERCKNKSSGFIAKDPDRLLHTLLDLLAENYKPVMDEISEELEEVEDMVMSEDTGNLIPTIVEVRKELGYLRRILRPQEALIHRVAKGEFKYVRSKMLPYYRDLHDKLIKIDDLASSYTEHLLLSFELHLNKNAAQTNEGIKVLTALTAITLPPVVIGGWYGMNFQHMPELAQPYSYYIVIALTLLSMLGMFFWIKSKKWF